MMKHDKYTALKVESLERVIAVLDSVGIGIPVKMMFDRTVSGEEFMGGAVKQFFHSTGKPSNTSMYAQCAFATDLIVALSQYGFKYNTKASREEGMMMFQRGQFAVGLLVGDDKGLAISHEEVYVGAIASPANRSWRR